MKDLSNRIASLTPEQRAQLARRLRQKVEANRTTIKAQPRDTNIFPVSFGQERLWFVHELVPDSPLYNVCVAMRVNGIYEVPVLERGIAVILERHEVLRTTFTSIDGQPKQVINPPGPFTLTVVNIETLAPEPREAEITRLIAEQAALPFDLETGPLIRFLLIQPGPDEFVLVMTANHIICDGLTMGLFIQELVAILAAFFKAQPSPLPPLELQYADYAVWQRQWLTGQVLDEQLDFWRDQLKGELPNLDLPTDYARPPVQTFRGDRMSRILDRPLSDRVKALAQESGITLFNILLAAYNLLLYQYTQQRDLIVGLPAVSRPQSELESLIGFFVNALPLRTKLAPGLTIRELLGQVRDTTLNAFSHQHLPLEKLLDELELERDLSRFPLFQTVFVLLQDPMKAIELPGYRFSIIKSFEGSYQIPTGATKYDLTLEMTEVDGVLAASFEYSTDLFSPATIERMTDHYALILDQMAANLDATVESLTLLSPAERTLVTETWNQTQTDYPRTATVPELFSQQAAANPTAIAISMGATTLTYGELEATANQLAHHLIAQGVKRGDIVAVALERSPELIITLLGVLKAGAAYAPLDLNYPLARLEWMVEDLRPLVMVSHPHALPGLPSSEATIIDATAWSGALAAQPTTPPAVPAQPLDLAYVMYTSGSTGRPKGIEIPHRAIVRLVRDTNYLPFDASLVTLLLAPTAFDASTLELWGALLNGGRVAITPPQQLSLAELRRVISAEGVNTMWLTAGLFHQMVDHELDGLRPLRFLLAGGDALSVDHVRRVLEHLPEVGLINGYGPTENTTFTCCHQLSLADVGPEARSVPIGRPIANTTVYILNERMEPLPVGTTGELYVGGDGLALGYLNRPDLTSERFVANPFTPGERLYRTGDMVRHLPDGRIEFLGRADAQVKVRGFRIELGEIETIIRSHAAVKDTTVIVREDSPGDKRIVAYVVLNSGEEGLAKLQQDVRGLLPEYMAPNAYVVLEELPLTANGKVDRRALPQPNRTSATVAYVPPRSSAERELAAMWGELLGLERIGVHDNFFASGGHSLLATQLVSRLRARYERDIPLRLLFEAPTIAQLAAALDSGETASASTLTLPPISASERKGALPLSYAQRRLWFLDQLLPPSPLYNVPLALRVNGPLNITALEQAIATLIMRHEGMRTRFQQSGGEPYQVIEPVTAYSLPITDLRGLDAAQQEERAQAIAKTTILTPFDLAQGPLFRAHAVQIGAEDWLLAFAFHHIVSDGWSLGVFSRELSLAYAQLTQGQTPDLPPLELQYADYALWQQRWLTPEALEDQLAYWRQELANPPTLLNLPTDRPRPPVQGHSGGYHSVEIRADLLQGLKELGQQQGATLFMTMLAAFQTLLARLSGQSDILVGTPIANRTRSEIESIIGFFVNTLVIRGDLRDQQTFAELVAQIRERTLGAYAHQDVPFEQLVDALQPERALDHTPLFQTMFMLRNTPPIRPQLAGAKTRLLEADGGIAKFDLSLEIIEEGPTALAVWEYNIDLFDSSTIERMAKHYTTLLEAALSTPEATIADLPLLQEPEILATLHGWNATRQDYDTSRSVPELIAAQAQATPDVIALVFEGQTLTYGELNARANQLAHYLRAHGVGRETRVGIAAERSLELVVGLLGIMKAGAAYVPMDPSYPAERLAYMVESAAVALLLTQGHLRAQLPSYEGPIVELDTHWDEVARHPTSESAVTYTPSQLAYVIYTSGSTGRPKGAMNTHAGLLNRLLWMQEAYQLTPNDRVVQKTPFSFDVSVWEFFWPLMVGARLVIAKPDGHRDSGYLIDLIGREGITTMHFVPSMLQVFLADPDVAKATSLRQIMCSGEALPPEAVRRCYAALPQATLHNLYGPTEAAIDVTAIECEPEPSGATVPIGRPIANTQIYLLDQRLRPVPVGVPGELYIGGVNVGRGYLGRPDLTAERFVPDPFAATPGLRMYRTGDLARFAPDGMIEYLGRLDHQIKLRGFRIELSEIEAALQRQSGVKESVVIAHRDHQGDTRLIAYATPASLEPQELLLALRRELPEYMVPSLLMPIAELPLSPNGKLERRALPTPVFGTQAAYIAPRSATEIRLAEVWRNVLAAKRVGIDDNFFALGGHSLLATQVIARVREVFNVELPLRALFEQPTLAGLAQEIDLANANPALQRLQAAPRDGDLPLSFSQQRLWFIDQLMPGNGTYTIAGAVRIRGPMDAAAWERALNAVVARHEALRTRFVVRDGNPTQVIDAEQRLELPLIDLSADSAQEATLADAILKGAQEPFSLSEGPLIRGTLYRLGEGHHVLFLAMHHIVSDGWSMGVLIRELALLCQAYSGGAVVELEPLPIHYADYAVWQQEWFKSEAAQAQLDFWKTELRGAPMLLELPTDRPRPPVQSYRGATYTFELPTSLASGVHALGQRHSATPFMVLLAAFESLLYRYSGQEDMLIGSPIANRTRSEVEGLIGFFVNTLVLRADVSGNPSFAALLERVRAKTLQAYANQDTPFEQVVEALQPPRSTSHTPLFQVMFIVQNTPMPTIDSGELRIEPLELDGGAAKFDLTVAFEETANGLKGSIEYSTDLFDSSTIERLAQHYATLLEAALSTPEATIADLPLLQEPEILATLHGWNATRQDYDTSRSVPELIAAQAQATPDVIALVFEGQTLTYGELNARANQLAHYLREHGIGRETRVGIAAERSLELVVGLLGIMKAGAAYVPMDPSYPAERLAYMVESAAVALLLTQGHLRAQLPSYEGPIVELDTHWDEVARHSSSEPAVAYDPSQLAYVIYTSGSTGRPKGAMNTHAGLLNRLLWMQEAYQLTPNDRVVQKTPFSFDVSVWEFFWPLMVGARLVIAKPDGHRDSGYLIDLIGREGITTMHFVPSMLQVFLADPDVAKATSLRQIMCSGEALPPEAVRRCYAALPQATLHNLYGPTEAAIDVTAIACEPEPSGATVPIGRPIANTQIYLLDQRLRPVPVGVPGELYIGGVNVGRGYLGRPDLTAERFVPDPFAATPGLRMYRTGDLARFAPDGMIEYLGRLDHQIKLRGFRIELSEIEAALQRQSGVKESVVIAHRDYQGDTRLIAYATPASLEPQELLLALRRELPEYMVPSLLMPIAELPLSPNGKLERRALPAPVFGTQAAYIAPRSATETALAEIWRSVLAVERVGIDDNFFDLGGHSLLLAQVRVQLQSALSRSIAMIDLFEHPTVRALAAHLDRDAAQQAELAESAERAERRRAALQRRPIPQRSRTEPAGDDDDVFGDD